MASVGIIGAGTMGAGIAQVAAAGGWTVELMDVDASAVERAIGTIRKRFDRLVEKGRWGPADRNAAAERLRIATDAACLGDCELIIEAVAEDPAVKVGVFERLISAARADAILASNTSSLSITKMGRSLGQGRRFVGMHFFNPVPLLPLVEVIAGAESAAGVVERAVRIAGEWGKTPVRVRDTPGFIVNRVARGYYLEPLRMLGEGIAGVDEIDGILKTLGGFRMGPFELMDLVGIDVNYTVSTSVWEQMDKPARLAPHAIQKGLFERGEFGRKTKRGYYDYEQDPPLPAVPVERKSFGCPPRVHKAVRRFADGASAAGGSITEQYVFARTLGAIINEAALALDQQVATLEDIDTAMKLGTNYPNGPLEWAERIGRHTCAALLRGLNKSTDDDRFAAADWLQA